MRKDLVEKECAFCGTKVLKRRSSPYKKSFCSHECQGAYRTTGVMINCAVCGTESYRSQAQLKRSKSGDHFCSRSCATVYNNKKHKTGVKHPNYTTGYGSYRERALRVHGPKCSNHGCELRASGIEVDISMLDVDHIDDNRKNNHISNLQVLCVWCHAKKTRLSGYS